VCTTVCAVSSRGGVAARKKKIKDTEYQYILWGEATIDSN
jgi:hypothetical protein